MNAVIDSNAETINTILLVEGGAAEYYCTGKQQMEARSSLSLDDLSEDTFLNNHIEGKDTPAIIFVNTFFSLYPRLTVAKEQAAMALRTTLSRPNDFLIKDEEFGFKADVGCIYAISATTLEKLYRWHLGLKLHHVAPLLLSFITEFNKTTSAKKINLHLLSNHFFISVMDGGSIVLAQMFKISSPVDLLYFTLAVYEDLGLDPNLDPLIFSGNIASGGQYYEKLFQYIKYLEPLEPSLDPKKGHEIFSLFV
jgi:hypothetical protein